MAVAVLGDIAEGLRALLPRVPDNAARAPRLAYDDGPSEPHVTDDGLVRVAEVDAIDFTANNDRSRLPLTGVGVQLVQVVEPFEPANLHLGDIRHVKVRVQRLSQLERFRAGIAGCELQLERCACNDPQSQFCLIWP